MYVMYDANFDAVSSKRANFNEVQFFQNIHLFDRQNLQTFKHNTLINELRLMQFYLFNVRPKLRH